MTTLRAPSGLAARGRQMWRDLTALTEFDPAQLVLLEEACRIADRLDKLDALLTGEESTWLRFRPNQEGDEVTVVIDSALSEARQQANVLKQIVTALRIPDAETGKKPQHRGARGAYQPSGKASGKVSSLDRARAARGA